MEDDGGRDGADARSDRTGEAVSPEQAQEHEPGYDPMRGETPQERADRNWGELLQELRVTQTVTQLLTGFLLTVAFQPAFATLTGVQRAAYLVLVGLAALSSLFALTPVIIHRVLFGRRVKALTVRWGSLMLTASLAVIGLVLVGIVFLVFDVAVGHPGSLWAAGATVVAAAALWGAGPAWVASRIDQDRD